MDAPSPSAIHSPGPSSLFDDRSLDGFSLATSLPASHQVPTSSSSSAGPHASKRRPHHSASSSTCRDRNFSSSSSVGAGAASRLFADFLGGDGGGNSNHLHHDLDDTLVGGDEDATDFDDDYDDDASADGDNDRTNFPRNSYWETRKFPLVGEDLEDLGLENGEAEEDVWFGSDVRIVDRGVRGRYASETAATSSSSPFRKADPPSRSASLDHASTSSATGAGGDATSALHHNGDGKIAPPLTPSSTSGLLGILERQ